MEILTVPQSINTRLLTLLAAILLSLFGQIIPSATTIAADSLEYSVKAAYLTKFGIYVEWPENAFASATSAINICVTGEDPFGQMLDEATYGQRIHDRALIVRRLPQVTRDSACHILFIGRNDTQTVNEIIETTRGSNVLTVTDTRWTRERGIINFVLKDNRVRFNIDNAAAQENGLTISSRLLVLALNVKQ